KSFAEEAGIRENAAVELSLDEGKLVIRPAVPKAPTLAELLEGVTDENRPGEWGTGPAVGKEVWGSARQPTSRDAVMLYGSHSVHGLGTRRPAAAQHWSCHHRLTTAGSAWHYSARSQVSKKAIRSRCRCQTN